MQTIASLVDRLDMTPEQAVETLRKLEFDIEGVETFITDDQCDLLMDVDEDPSTLEARLKEIQARREREEKRAQQAAKKKATAKKPAAKKTGDEESVLEPALEVEILADAPEPEAVVEVVAEPEPVVVIEEAPAVPEAVVEEVVEVPAPEPVEEPLPEAQATQAAPHIAEILSDDYPVEVQLDEFGEPVDPNEIPKAKLSKLAEAERKQEEHDRRKEEIEKRRKERPLPEPDPEVVAEVIRRNAERERRRLEPRRPPGATAGAAGAPGQRGPAPAGGSSGMRNVRGSGPAPINPANVVPLEAAEELKKRAMGAGGAAGKAAKKKPKRAERGRLLEETMRRDAAAMVREFTGGVGMSTAKRRKRKKSRDGEFMEQHQERRGGVIDVQDAMTVEQLAVAMDVPVNDLILALMDDDILATKNQVIEIDVIRKLAELNNFEIRLEIPEEEAIMAEEPDAPEDLVLRAPVITVMGHVDHGKTSFLDVIREASVADGEAGGITQHIAAYDVQIPTGRVVFLDTPGHAAFSEMRARGSQVTDVVVLMVAADDGVKPQTVEAIDHAKAAGVPIVVAINKCDKAGADPGRVRQELTQYQLLAEEWGGSTQMQNISCHTREGIPELLELLGLESQMLELKANPNKSARGAVVESEMSKGVGPTAWVLVQNGTLKLGDAFLCGKVYGRVRTMQNSQGRSIEEAGPSTPVLVTGLSEPADAGDQFIVVKEERIAREIAAKRQTQAKRRSGSGAKHMTLEDFHARVLGQERKVLNIIVKTDVQGSVDAIESSMLKLGNEEVSINIVHSGVGGVNESDVMLASASDAVIIAFHVTANAKIQKLAEQEGVEIRTYRIIYEAIDEVRNALEGMLTPDKKEIIVGHAEVRAVFRSSAVGNIAGSYQLDGETSRGERARLIRNDVVVYEGKIGGLRRLKDEVKTVAAGFECGITLDNFSDIQEGDIIETYRVESIAKKLV